jgi:hypothetical protein
MLNRARNIAMYITAAVAIVWGIDYCSHPSSTQSSAMAPSASSDNLFPPQVGSQYVIGKGVSRVICTNDDDALNKALDALGKNDKDGAEQALGDSVIAVAPGTTILILNYDLFKGVVDMRVRTGENAGSRVYCEVGNDNNGFLAKQISGD